MDDGSRVLERTPSLLVAGSRTFPNFWQNLTDKAWILLDSCWAPTSGTHLAPPFQIYLLVAPHFWFPAKQHALNAPRFRRQDLSLAATPLIPGSAKALGFIDWQDVVILPLFMQAGKQGGRPAFREHDVSGGEQFLVRLQKWF
ncbi:uncharacterized protein PADG_12352 [Paracoccidioides brasiliensis Pb18]|uniref:Uncharacterized protein n=1 Tax=Paracoccidioides brasiliensis (strain Pb18) TaxID=502780 RepID=A0A0A0HSE6_PARBD|nr:uncharacterized protein PADG_12352 [Paracoccidioides brasiliensis Pb18]KGM91577.1 hypothetical protein PADG_12352 [Paracoccidioides brasiliensis Pb18]